MARFMVTAAAILGLAAPATSWALRCGSALIQVEDPITKVLEHCGEPMRRAQLVDDDGDPIGSVLYFEGGYGKPDRRIELVSGRVTLIERLED